MGSGPAQGHLHTVHVVIQLPESIGRQLLLTLGPGSGLLLCGEAIVTPGLGALPHPDTLKPACRYHEAPTGHLAPQWVLGTKGPVL